MEVNYKDLASDNDETGHFIPVRQRSVSRGFYFHLPTTQSTPSASPSGDVNKTSVRSCLPDWAKKSANWATFGSRWLPKIWLWRLATFWATF